MHCLEAGFAGNAASRGGRRYVCEHFAGTICVGADKGVRCPGPQERG